MKPKPISTFTQPHATRENPKRDTIFLVRVAFEFNESNAAVLYSAFLARASSDRMTVVENLNSCRKLESESEEKRDSFSIVDPKRGLHKFANPVEFASN